MLDLGGIGNEYSRNLKRFMDYIVSRHRDEDYSRSFGLNREAKALFSAIQEAFIGVVNDRGLVVVHKDLVSHLAACASVALNYNKDQSIPWDESDHDYIIRHVLRGFVATLVNAINASQVRQRRDGEMYFGCFPIPDWFIAWAQSWSWSCWYKVAEA